MKHFGYDVIKFPVNEGRSLNYSHKMNHNICLKEILQALDPSLIFVGSVNTSQSISELQVDALFYELCRMNGGVQLLKIMQYSRKLNRRKKAQFNMVKRKKV